MTQQIIINTENIQNGALIINGVEVYDFPQINIESELNLRTFIFEYRYFGCLNWFKKEIPAESIEEAAFDAQAWIESENATIGNRAKAGNYIDLAFIREWNGKNQKVLKF